MWRPTLELRRDRGHIRPSGFADMPAPSHLDATVALLALLADPTRLRLLHLCDGEELTVAELQRITDLPQSRVSTHLGKLRAAGLLLDRRAGTSTFYMLRTEALSEEVLGVWDLLRTKSADDRVLQADRKRRDAVVDARRTQAAWPDEVAGRMEHHYSPGRTWEATARGLIGLLHLGDVLDIGSGDGVIASLLAGRARSLTCLDHSERVLEAARNRLGPQHNVDLRLGDMHALPFADASFDQVLHLHALTYSHDPAAALAEAHRVLRPGGDLVLLTLHEHAHADVTASYSQVNNGFAPADLQALAAEAGFRVSHCDVTSRERRKPYFEVVSVFASKPARPGLRTAGALAI
jgi:SAM-dependent methyltransferase